MQRCRHAGGRAEGRSVLGAVEVRGLGGDPGAARVGMTADGIIRQQEGLDQVRLEQPIGLRKTRWD